MAKPNKTQAVIIKNDPLRKHRPSKTYTEYSYHKALQRIPFQWLTTYKHYLALPVCDSHPFRHFFLIATKMHNFHNFTIKLCWELS